MEKFKRRKKVVSLNSGFAELVRKVEGLKVSEIKGVIDQRMKEFEDVGKKSSPEIFQELSFCLLTANFNAQRSIDIQDNIGSRFLTLPKGDLTQKLREFGHRFPEARANYIIEAREHKGNIKETLESFDDESQMRDWVAENVKGLGYKESSHFLRNIGYKNFAIVDFHIIDLLVRHGLIERPKTLTKKRYLEIEGVLKKIGKELGLNMAELDLYLWYLETGKVLK